MHLSFWPWVAITLGIAGLAIVALRAAQWRTLRFALRYGGDLSEPLNALHLNGVVGADDGRKVTAVHRAELVAEIARRQEALHTYVRIGLTLLVILAALFVVLSRSYGDAEQKWAFGAIGTVLGYWLKQ